MKNNSMRKLFLIVLPALILPCLPAFAAEDVAVLNYIEGTVLTKLNDETEWGGAEINMMLQESDAIKTDAKSKAKIVLEDGSTVTVGPLSVFVIGSVTRDYNTGKKSATFDLQEGKARATVTKLTTSDSTFEIITPTAVAGVRGTDFMVEIDAAGEKSTITVFEGVVEVRSRIQNILDRVQVEKDQATDVGRNLGPAAPRKLTPDRIKNMKEEMARRRSAKDVEVAQGLEDDGASCMVSVRGAKLPENKKAELAKGIETGQLPLQQVKDVLGLTHRGLSPDQAGKAIDLIRSRKLKDRDVRDFVDRAEKAKNDADFGAALDDFDRATKDRPGRPAPGEAGKPGAADRANDRFDSQGKPGAPTADVENKDELDKQKDDLMDRGGPDAKDPRRRERMLIQKAIDMGIPREKLEPIILAFREKRLDPMEFELVIKAIIKGFDPGYFKELFSRMDALKIDPASRRLVLMALSLGYDRKDLIGFFDRLQDAGLSLSEIRDRLLEYIKGQLPKEPPGKVQGETPGAPDAGAKSAPKAGSKQPPVKK